MYSVFGGGGVGNVPLGKPGNGTETSSFIFCISCILQIHVSMGEDMKPLLLSFRCGSKELRDHHHLSLNIMKI